MQKLGKKHIKNNYVYGIISILAILFPITYYPMIQGTDAFQILWMAQAIKEGALFSQPTWLISIFSYFGYYPFSHRAVGVPIILCLLLIMLEIISLGIEEAVLLYCIIVSLFTVISSKKLAETVFNGKWEQYLFTGATVFSTVIIMDISMTVSTRIIITIITMYMLDCSIKILKQKKMNYRNILSIISLILIGMFVHRLWTVVLIIPIIALIAKIILKLSRIRFYSLYLMIPIAVSLLIFGYNYFTIDPDKIFSPFFDNNTALGVTINLITHYTLQIGAILAFLPIGVIIVGKTIYRELKNNKEESIEQKNIIKHSKKYEEKTDIYYYLIQLMLFFFFTLFTFYAIVIFLPIIVILSIIGFKGLMIFLEKKLKLAIDKELILASILVLGASMYTLLYVIVWLPINYWHIVAMISLICISTVFFIFAHKLQIKNVNIQKLYALFKKTLILCAILAFTITTVVGRITYIQSSSFPWENRYLTEEEKDIINFLKQEEIEGIIFTINEHIAIRLTGGGFLPVFYDRSPIGPDGTPLYYNIITPEEVKNNTVFSISGIFRLSPFGYNRTHPIRQLYSKVRNLNVSREEHMIILKDNNIQYIISVNPQYYGEAYSPLKLELSLNADIDFMPVFSTKHFDIWNIY